MPGAGGAGGPTPGGSARTGQTWGTGGLNFDTKGIDQFKDAMKKAADEVERFWKPFTDTRRAQDQTKKFFEDFQKHIKQTAATAEKLGVPLGKGTGPGGRQSPSLGGDSTISANSHPAIRRARTGAQFFHGDDEPDTGFIAAYKSARTSQGGYRNFAGASMAGMKAGLSSVGLSPGQAALLGAAQTARMAQNYVNRNAEPAVVLQSAANTLAYTQDPRNQNWSTGYRDDMQRTLNNQGFGFTGREDRAAVASMLQRTGINVIGPGNQVTDQFRQTGAMALMTGVTGAQQASNVANLSGAGTVNAMRAIGVNIRPGGKLQNQTTIYKELRDYIYAPLGRKPTKDEVQVTLRLPGTPANLLVQQVFQGDPQGAESFIQWVENSAAAGKDLMTANDLGQAPGAQTTAARLRRQGETTEKQRGKGDVGLLRGLEDTAAVSDAVHNALGGLESAIQPVTDQFTRLAGTLGQTMNLLPGGGGGGGGGGGVMGSLVKGVGTYAFGKGVLSMGKSVLGKLGGGGAEAATEAAAGAGAGEAGAAALPLLGEGALVLGAGVAAYGATTWALHHTPLGSAVKAVASHIPGLGGSKSNALKDEKALLASQGNLTPWGTPQGDQGFYVNHKMYTWGPGGKGDYSTYPGGAAQAKKDQKDEGDASWGMWDMGDADTQPVGVPAVKLPGPGHSEGMDPDFLTRLAKMFADNPRLSLTSGFRTQAEQARLYKEKPGLAAPPGKSKHQQGLAADIGPRSEYGWIAQNVAKYGLYLPMPSKEPWHVQPTGLTGSSAAGVTASETMAAEDAPQGGQGSGARIAAAAGGNIAGNIIPWSTDTTPPWLRGPISGGPPKSATAAATPTGAQTTGTAPTPVNANPSQSDIMATILRVGQSMGADPQMLLAAFETGWAESSMTDLKGGDRDSMGVFQQRPSQGWGTPEQVTNVDYAATQFFKRAAGSRFRGKGTAAQMAQDVQRSAFADGSNYQKQRGKAVSSLAGLGVNVSDIGDAMSGAPQPAPMKLNVQGGGTTINIAKATFTAQIARATPDEAENFARSVMSTLGNRQRLLAISEG